MGVRDLIVGFLRADVPLAEIEPFRRAASDAYGLVEETPPESWARLAAWNAFLLQVYGDNLILASSSGRYVATEAVIFARRLFEQANLWVEETRKAQASDAYRFRFGLPHPLPHWLDRVRSDAQLAAMRVTLDVGRTRAKSAFNVFAGEDSEQQVVRIRLAEIDAESTYIERLWTKKPTNELRATTSAALADALDHVYELGQLLAQPELFGARR